jgi:hypothetical protein
MRYFGTQGIKALVDARRQTSEAAYIAMMRSRFGFQHA